jgi:hypothetical protein
VEKQFAEINIGNERKKYVAGLIIAIAAINGFITLVMGSEMNFVYYDILRIGTIASAAVLSFVVFGKQGSGGLFGRAYTGLAVGLVMWLIAESIWGYYEVVLGEESPFPSIADAFWLGAYGGLLYYVFSLYKFFGKGINKLAVIGVVGAIAIFAFFYLESLVSVSIPPEGEEGNGEFVLPLAISVAYPVLDFILLIPAILMVFNSGRGYLTAVPWVFVSFILTAVADILLGYQAVVGFEDVTLVTMLYNSAYLCMAAGLLWYLRFFISGQKQIIKPQ